MAFHLHTHGLSTVDGVCVLLWAGLHRDELREVTPHDKGGVKGLTEAQLRI